MQKKVLILSGPTHEYIDPVRYIGNASSGRMGKALAELGDLDRAEDHLRRALMVQRDNSTLFAAYGKVLEALDRTTEAARAYRQGVEVASRRGDLMPLKDMQHRLMMLDV